MERHIRLVQHPPSPDGTAAPPSHQASSPRHAHSSTGYEHVPASAEWRRRGGTPQSSPRGGVGDGHVVRPCAAMASTARGPARDVGAGPRLPVLYAGVTAARVPLACLAGPPMTTPYGPATQVVRRRVQYPGAGEAGPPVHPPSAGASLGVGGGGVWLGAAPSHLVHVCVPPHLAQPSALTSGPVVVAEEAPGLAVGQPRDGALDVARKWRRARPDGTGAAMESASSGVSSCTHSGSFAWGGPSTHPQPLRKRTGCEDPFHGSGGGGGDGGGGGLGQPLLARSARAPTPLRCTASPERHGVGGGGGVAGSAIIASRHGGRASLPRLMDGGVDVSTCPTPTGPGSSKTGSYSRRGSSISSYHTVSMHSLATRQKNDDNFDFGLDALGIPAGELRSTPARTAGGSAAGLFSVHSSASRLLSAQLSSGGGTDTRPPVTPPPSHRRGPPVDDAALRGSHGGEAPESRTVRAAGLRGSSSPHFISPPAPPAPSAPALSRSSQRSSTGHGSSSPLQGSSLLHSGTHTMSTPARTPPTVISGSAAPPAPTPAGLRGGPDAGVMDTSSQALLRSTTLTARRVDASLDPWLDVCYDFGAETAGTPLLAMPGWGQMGSGGGGCGDDEANALAGSPAADGVPLYGTGTGTGAEDGRDDSYRRLFGIEKDDDEDSIATDAGDDLPFPASSHAAPSSPHGGMDRSTSSDGGRSDDSSGSSRGSEGSSTSRDGSSGSSNSSVAGPLGSAVVRGDGGVASPPVSLEFTRTLAAAGEVDGARSQGPRRVVSSITSDQLCNISAYFPLASSVSVSNHGGGGGGGGGTTGSVGRLEEDLPASAASDSYLYPLGMGSLAGSGAPHVPLSERFASTAPVSALGSAHGSVGSPGTTPSVRAVGEGGRLAALSSTSSGAAGRGLRAMMGGPQSMESFRSSPARSPTGACGGLLASGGRLAGPPPALASTAVLPPQPPRVYRDERGRVLEGIDLWERPVMRPVVVAPSSGSGMAPSRTSAGSAWVRARGLVLVETPTGARPRSTREPAVTLAGHCVTVRAGGLQGSCTVDECVGRTQGSAALPSVLLTGAQQRFHTAAENVFVVLMDRVGSPAALAVDTAPPAVPLLPAILHGVLRETARAHAPDAAGETVDLRLALAFLPRSCADGGGGVTGGGRPTTAPLSSSFVELIDDSPVAAAQVDEGSGSGSDRAGRTTPTTPIACRALEVASSPIFGPCINGCRWLLVEREADIDSAVHCATARLARVAAAGVPTSEPTAAAAAAAAPPLGSSHALARACDGGVLWAQFLLQRRTAQDVLVSTFTVAATADAALLECVLDQRAGSPWPLFRNALGKGPCTVVAVAGLSESDAEAAYPLAVLQRMLRTPHPPPQRGSVAAYVAMLRRRRAELERAQAGLGAVEGDGRHVAMRLEKVAANLVDALTFLEQPDSGAVPIYVDVAPPRPRPTLQEGEGRGVAESGACGAVVGGEAYRSRRRPGREGGAGGAVAGAARQAPTHWLPAAAVATVALAQTPLSGLTAGAVSTSPFTWHAEGRRLAVAAAPPAGPTAAAAAAPTTASFAFTGCARVPVGSDGSVAALLSAPALGPLADRFRDGFNSFAVFLHAGGPAGAPVDPASPRPSLAAAVDYAAGVVERALSRPLLTHARRAARRRAETEAQQRLRLQGLRDKGLVLRLSASMYVARGDTVVDLFGLDEAAGDGVPDPFGLVLARSPLLGLSPMGVVQRNIRSVAQFRERLQLGLRRLARLRQCYAAARAGGVGGGRGADAGAAEPRVVVLSLQLKQQDPVTCDVVVSCLTLLSLGQQAALLSDRLARRAGPPAEVHALLADALHGAGHCACVVVLPDMAGPQLPAAAARRVLGVLQRVAHVGRRAGSQRVQLGSVARLLLRMRHLRAKVQRGRDRFRARRNTSRIDKVVFDAEQLLYHPDEHEPRYYARAINGAGVGVSAAADLQGGRRSALAAALAADGSTLVAVDAEDGVGGAVFDDADTAVSSLPRAGSRVSGPARGGATGAAPPSPALSTSTARPMASPGVGLVSYTAAGAGPYYGTRFECDPPLMEPQSADTASLPCAGARRAGQMRVPALVVVSAAAAGETSVTAAGAESGFVVDVEGPGRVGVRRAGAAEGSASLSGCEADEVVEIRTASSSMRSLTLARTLSCVVSGRTAAVLAMDTAAATDACAVSWLLVRTAVAALFASLDDAASPYVISLRAFGVTGAAAEAGAMDLLRPLVESQQTDMVGRARAGVAAGSGSDSPPLGPAPGAVEGVQEWAMGGAAPGGGGTAAARAAAAGERTSPCDTAGPTPLLHRVRFSPLCGPTYGSATALAVHDSQHFDTLLAQALSSGAATCAAPAAVCIRGVVLELAVHQFPTTSGDVVISALWYSVTDADLVRRAGEGGGGGGVGALATTHLPYFLGGPCYTTAVLGLSRAPAPAEMDRLSSVVSVLRGVRLTRPRLGSVRAYEAFLQRCLAGLRESLAAAGDRGGADEDKSAALPRLTAMLNEARALRTRAPESYRQAGKVPGLLAHEAKFFRAFDD